MAKGEAGVVGSSAKNSAKTTLAVFIDLGAFSTHGRAFEGGRMTTDTAAQLGF